MWTPNGLQGAVQQIFSSHVDVRFGLLVLVLVSKVAHDGVQVERNLHSKDQTSLVYQLLVNRLFS